MTNETVNSSAVKMSGAGQPSGARRRFTPIKVMDIDLSCPITDLEDLTGYAAVKILVRLQGTPLGDLQLALSDGRCAATTIRRAIVSECGQAITRYLMDIGVAAVVRQDGLCIEDLVNIPVPVYNGPFPLVTVAICSHERPTNLELCLDAVCRLDYPALEILVIDNAPRSDITERLVCTHYPRVRYIREPHPGLSWARNRAVLESKGMIIAYTDDDVVVDARWINALTQVFTNHPYVMAVTGLIVPYELETEAQLLFERHGGFGRGFERRWFRGDREPVGGRPPHLSSGRCGTGANMAYRRDLFDRIGIFAPVLGAGTPTTGGEDIEMFFRILHEGYTLVYEPRAIVRHRHRRDYADLRTQIAGNGIGLSAYFMHSIAAYPDQRANFMRLGLRWLWRWHIKRLIKSLLRWSDFPADLIMAEWWGYMCGPGRYRKSRRIAADIERTFGPLTATTSVSQAQPPAPHMRALDDSRRVAAEVKPNGDK